MISALLEGFKIFLTTEDGHCVTYNLESKLKTARFCGLSSEEVFRKGRFVDNNKIVWDNIDTELYISEIVDEMLNSDM